MMSSIEREQWWRLGGGIAMMIVMNTVTSVRRAGARAAARDDPSSAQFPDFQFPQMENPQLAPPGWHPRLLDYVYFSFSNGTAFSATDVMPLSHWAKTLMMVQAGSSLLLVVLVTARAVNVL
jgi:uncharacterized membrane protein